MNIISLPPFLVGTFLFSSEWSRLQVYPNWDKPSFYIILFCSCVQAFLINYTTFWCTTVNSPLTTSIVGQLSKILTIAFGYLMMTDAETITVWNVIGVLVGLFGSVAYSAAEYRDSQNTKVVAYSEPPQQELTTVKDSSRI